MVQIHDSYKRSSSSSVYLGSTSNQETQKHNMNNKNKMVSLIHSHVYAE